MELIECTLNVLEQFWWPVLDRCRDVVGPKRIHGVNQTMTICMECSTQRFRRAGLVTSDFEYVIGAQVTQN